MSMTSEELEGFPYGTSNLPDDGIHDLMIEDYLARQVRYAREDAMGRLDGQVKPRSVSRAPPGAGYARAAVVGDRKR